MKNRNSNREDYEENRQEGYIIKYYKSVRHKNEPKFVKRQLTKIHNSNIKRKTKFAGTLNFNDYYDIDGNNPGTF